MPQEVTLNFNTEDVGLNLTGIVNFPNAFNLNGISAISVRGLADWRHVPANIIHVNQNFMSQFHLTEKAKNMSKVGINFIGLQAHTDVLLSHAVRQGKNGTTKVQALLTKFFKAIGASSVKFSLLNAEAEMSQQEASNGTSNPTD